MGPFSVGLNTSYEKPMFKMDKDIMEMAKHAVFTFHNGVVNVEFGFVEASEQNNTAMILNDIINGDDHYKLNIELGDLSVAIKLAINFIKMMKKAKNVEVGLDAELLYAKMDRLNLIKKNK